MLSVSITILTVLLVVVSVLIILIVMMQRPKQEGLGAAFGGGMMNDIAGAHTTDILQKGTVWLAVFFFTFSILLGILYTRKLDGQNNIKVLDAVKQEQIPQGPQPSFSDLPAPISLEDLVPPAGDTPGDSTPVPAPASEGGAPEKADDAAPPTADGEKPSENQPEPPKTESGKSEGAETPAENGTPQ